MSKEEVLRIYNIQKYSLHDGGGIRTVVFLKGCPLRCLWCCNPESQSPEKELIYRRTRCIGMQKCGVEPWETMVVENAPLGVRAAVAARCFTIAVNTGPLPDEMLQKEGANLTFPRMTLLAEAYHQWYPSAYHAG